MFLFPSRLLTSPRILFARRLLRHPREVGSIAPSSAELARRMAALAVTRGALVVELGAGTGVMTRALLQRGLPADRLFVIERDRALALHLRRTFPQLNILEGDAADLPKLLPRDIVGQVTAILSSLPLVAMPGDVQQKILTSASHIMTGGGRMIQFTYRWFGPPAPAPKSMRLRRIGQVLRNIPPATIWSYTKNRSNP